MKYNADIHHRRSIRVRGHDYSSGGAYFITICAQERLCLFGDIANGEMRRNDAGRMVGDWWMKLPGKFPYVALDEYVIMPNHFHGIITIVGAPPCGCPPLMLSPCGCPDSDSDSTSTSNAGRPHRAAPTLGDAMDWFKTMTTNAYIRGVRENNWPPFPGRLWQRNYYERIIRDDAELNATREYIASNPQQWSDDAENPDCARSS